MRNKLDELKEYSKEINKRVEVFAKDIEHKELEIEKLKKEFSKAFISGKSTDTREMNKLKDELEDLKSQYNLIVQAIEEDEKMIELAKEVYNEHYLYDDTIKEVTKKHTKGIKEKELELEQLKANLNNEVSKIKQVQRNSKVERFDYIDYMQLSRPKRDEFTMDIVGQTYNNYKKMELEREGNTQEEINEFIRKDFDKMQGVR
jgi:uncharacterized phage infection (PIP) family protein YhgE